jgi:WD40 repeat protein
MVYIITKLSGAKNLRGHTGAVGSVAFSADGKYLASGSEDTSIRLWDLETGACGVLQGHIKWISTNLFSPDARYIASGSDDETIMVRDLQKGSTMTIWKSHPEGVCSVAFSPDGKRLVSSGY